MAEIRRGYEAGGGGSGGERLPWLEPVEDEDYVDERGSGRGVILAVLAVLVVVAVVAGGIAWLRREHAEQADVGTVIKAEPGPYKVRPTTPGGMEIASAGSVAERTGVGGDINSPLDLTAIPEQPVVGPGSPDGGQAAAAPAAQQRSSSPERGGGPPAKPVVEGAPVQANRPLPAAPRPAAPSLHPSPAASGPPPRVGTHESSTFVGPGAGEEPRTGAIQLGAFSTEAKAQAAWKSLSKRFGFLGGLTQTVSPVASGDATLYRLRANGPGAAGMCAKLKVAGETCSNV